MWCFYRHESHNRDEWTVCIVMFPSSFILAHVPGCKYGISSWIGKSLGHILNDWVPRMQTPVSQCPFLLLPFPQAVMGASITQGHVFYFLKISEVSPLGWSQSDATACLGAQKVSDPGLQAGKQWRQGLQSWGQAVAHLVKHTYNSA